MSSISCSVPSGCHIEGACSGTIHSFSSARSRIDWRALHLISTEVCWWGIWTLTILWLTFRSVVVDAELDAMVIILTIVLQSGMKWNATLSRCCWTNEAPIRRLSRYLLFFQFVNQGRNPGRRPTFWLLNHIQYIKSTKHILVNTIQMIWILQNYLVMLRSL